MKCPVKVTFLLALGFAAAGAVAKPVPYIWPELGVEASIAFPNYAAIRNFEADGDKGIWIEDQNRRWYYGAFLGTCHGLNFSQAIGFDTRGTSRFDRYSRILVEGDRCAFDNFVTAQKPLSRKERKRLAKAAKAAKASTN